MDTFSPDAFLTREQAAKVLVNVAAWFAGTELTGGTMPGTDRVVIKAEIISAANAADYYFPDSIY